MLLTPHIEIGILLSWASIFVISHSAIICLAWLVDHLLYFGYWLRTPSLLNVRTIVCIDAIVQDLTSTLSFQFVVLDSHIKIHVFNKLLSTYNLHCPDKVNKCILHLIPILLMCLLSWYNNLDLLLAVTFFYIYIIVIVTLCYLYCWSLFILI